MREQFARIVAFVAVGTLMGLAAVPASAKTTKECNDEYAANKTAIEAAKETKTAFTAACKALAEGQTTPIDATTTAAVTTPPATPPVTAPKAPPKPAATPVSVTGVTGTNEYATEADAKGKCGQDLVVWVNLGSKVYHFAGAKDYGTTKRGTYMCEKLAMAAGDTAAKNEKRP